jgi:hypothetical protein
VEPVGIYSSVTISKSDLARFYADRGAALIDDVRCILGKKADLQPHPYGGLIDPETGHHHDPHNKLVIRYDEATQTLLYFYQLELRDPDSMAEMPSFKAFAEIVAYRNGASTDYVAFSPSAPNFLTDELWRAYAFTQDGLKEIDPGDLPRDRQRAIDVWSWQYYWGPIEAMFKRMDRGEDVSYFDDFFPHHCFDPPLLALLGLDRPAMDPRMAPADYPQARRTR